MPPRGTLTSQITSRQRARAVAGLPTFAEGPGDELEDGLREFQEPKLASFGAAAHGGRGKAGLAVGAQKGRLPPCRQLELGACLGEPRELDAPQTLGEQHSCFRSESGFCIHGACRARCSLPSPSSPAPLPAVHSSPAHRRSAGCQGAGRSEDRAGERSREGGAGALPGLAVSLCYTAVAMEQLILSPKGGDRCTETLISRRRVPVALPLSPSLPPGESDPINQFSSSVP